MNLDKLYNKYVNDGILTDVKKIKPWIDKSMIVLNKKPKDHDINVILECKKPKFGATYDDVKFYQWISLVMINIYNHSKKNQYQFYKLLINLYKESDYKFDIDKFKRKELCEISNIVAAMEYTSKNLNDDLIIYCYINIDDIYNNGVFNGGLIIGSLYFDAFKLFDNVRDGYYIAQIKIPKGYPCLLANTGSRFFDQFQIIISPIVSIKHNTDKIKYVYPNFKYVGRKNIDYDTTVNSYYKNKIGVIPSKIKSIIRPNKLFKNIDIYSYELVIPNDITDQIKSANIFDMLKTENEHQIVKSISCESNNLFDLIYPQSVSELTPSAKINNKCNIIHRNLDFSSIDDDPFLQSLVKDIVNNKGYFIDFRKKIGRGVEGQIYLLCIKNDCEYVIKIQPLSLIGHDFEMRHNPRNEKNIMIILNNPDNYNDYSDTSIVPKFIDYWEQCINFRTYTFLVMEKMDGTLRNINQNGVNIDNRNQQIKNIMKILIHNNILYTDWHSNNVLYKSLYDYRKGVYIKLYLSDFGLATLINDDFTKSLVPDDYYDDSYVDDIIHNLRR